MNDKNYKLRLTIILLRKKLHALMRLAFSTQGPARERSRKTVLATDKVDLTFFG